MLTSSALSANTSKLVITLFKLYVSGLIKSTKLLSLTFIGNLALGPLVFIATSLYLTNEVGNLVLGSDNFLPNISKM